MTSSFGSSLIFVGILLGILLLVVAGLSLKNTKVQLKHQNTNLAMIICLILSIISLLFMVYYFSISSVIGETIALLFMIIGSVYLVGCLTLYKLGIVLKKLNHQ